MRSATTAAIFFAVYTFVCIGATETGDNGAVQRKSPLPPRQRDLQPEGSSLRRLILSKSSQPADANADEWEVFFDTNSGHPYYYNKHTGKTQWENPFGGEYADGDVLADVELYESWKIYERFAFRGIFDELFSFKHRHLLPRSGIDVSAAEAIEQLADADLTAAQARLEVVILKKEREAYAGEEAPSR